MRIALDATPAAIQQGGVGRYARELLRALVAGASDHRYVLATAAPENQARALLDSLPPGAWRELRRLPLSERWMTALWQRLRAPLPVERLIGPHDVFHGVDFTLPPSRAAKVVTIHDLSFIIYPEYAEPRLARYLSGAVPRSVDRADAIITVSASVAAELVEIYPHARGKVVAIPNGVRIPELLPERNSNQPPNVLLVGTVEPRKNHLTALRAIDIVRDTHKDARLICIGRPGWQSQAIERELHAAVARGAVLWDANTTDDELERIYAQAAVAISPSHYEGFGLPVLEALARGVPVVASDIAAHREVAGDAALYSLPDDPEALAAQILRLLDDTGLRDSLAASSRDRAAAFGWGETARRTLRVYAAAAGLVSQ